MSIPGSERPLNFVLVHGAWHGGWCWKRVSPLLRELGHEVFTPTLTGLGERQHLMSACAQSQELSSQEASGVGDEFTPILGIRMRGFPGNPPETRDAISPQLGRLLQDVAAWCIRQCC